MAKEQQKEVETDTRETEMSATLALPNTYPSWPKVSELLKKIQHGKVACVEDFEKMYLSLELKRDGGNRNHNPKSKFPGLSHVLKDGRYITESHFLCTLLPWIAEKALEVDKLFESGGHQIKLLRKQVHEEVLLSRRQVCCLLSLAFFSTFDRPEGGFQNLLFAYFLEVDTCKSQNSKFLCLLTYFDRIRRAESEKDEEFLSLNISVVRQGIPEEDAAVFWGKSEVLLGEFSCEREGLIEDAHGDLQVDFANEYIGGGVLQLGNVQEEIHFSINPECLVSILFCERMEDNEAILIQGAERFSKYSGYGSPLAFTGPYTDINPIDKQKMIRRVSIVAIDATPLGYEGQDEFAPESLARELNKAYCGFSFKILGDCSKEEGGMRPVATGNWGCGAFNGSKEYKTLLQWMAASVAGRRVRYYSFRDRRFLMAQEKIVALLREKGVTVGQLYQILVSCAGDMSEGGVFNCVREKIKQSI